ncbi:cytochrome b2, mitochondrial precursor [Scheffersomyces xylosifermentans]|uniref:cytochrome b2, mitochondrial precursor n=1 Tax=Scheffersomyces xylosifermentans TaxID=1304137 RepID=UPI00315DBFC9
MLDIEEVKKHNTRKDCWVIIHGKAYDVSDFVDEHPGGSGVILKYAGKDATKAFDPIHPGDTLVKYLAPKYHLGPFEDYDDDEDDPPSQEELRRRQKKLDKPDLSQMYNLNDFEFVARHTMERTAWSYYSSGCDDEITLRENHASYHRVFFKPRILVDVTNIDLSTTMLGTKVSSPFYITATALGRLGHKDGEKVLTRAAAKQDIIQMIPTLASCSFDEIVDEATSEQTQWLQLYVNKDREICEKIVRHAEERGIKGLFITVDAPQLGRREKDMRSKKIEDLSHVQGDDEEADRSQGAARAISSFIDTSLNWNDIKWFRSITKMPIILKGVQTVEDSLLAVEHGLDGIVLSNHGGRQLEFSKPPLEVLIELMPILKQKGLQDKMEIYLDGGVRRATDILKAICLGAKGVGIGRPFLYAMSTYGDAGVFKAIQILKDEMVMNMRLLGVTSIDQLSEKYIDTRHFQTRYLPEDKLFGAVYEPLVSPAFKDSKL